MLVDTSVWIDHLRRGNARLVSLLEDGRVYCHSLITGELACGHLSQRGEILELLENLPAAVAATHSEVLRLVESNRLWGRGLGWLDVHLLAAARLSGVGLWTKDRRLATVAAELGVGR